MFNSYSTKNFPQRFEKRIKEGANTQAKQLSKALQLDDVGSQAGHDAPNVVKTETSEVQSTADSCGDPADGGNDSVTPVLCGYKCAEAGPPDAINAVRTIGLSKHILKKDLGGK